jgi:hypothetical protein
MPLAAFIRLSAPWPKKLTRQVKSTQLIANSFDNQLSVKHYPGESMILHWQQLTTYYGGELARYRGQFDAAHQTTFGLLCCRLATGDDRFAASHGDHAEDRLLKTPLWTHEIPDALSRWTTLDDPMVVTLALNRSTCRNCAALVANGLNAIARQFPARVQQNRFVLAARGQYWGNQPGDLTLMSDLRRLGDAGWELAVLQVGAQLPERGQELLANLEKVTGRHGHLRLETTGHR